jgi:hypothetical protein
VPGEGGEEDWGVDRVLLGGCWVLEESEIVVQPSLERNGKCRYSYTFASGIRTRHFPVLSNEIIGVTGFWKNPRS